MKENKSNMNLQNRNTHQKQAIRQTFAMLQRPLSIEEVHHGAQQHASGLSIATVYRNVNAFLQEGSLVRVCIPDMPTRYELSSKEHHHHFYCTTCQKTFALSGCNMPEETGIPKGFQTHRHEHFVYGLCSDCNSASPVDQA